MARPVKEGLAYFPLDVDIDQDDKLVVPIIKFGTLGLGIIVRLMMAIYKNGYFYGWGEKEHYTFANRVNVDINLINEVVNECVKWGFFHQNILETYGVLTSKGFQNRYIGASKRRKCITFIKEYTLIDLKEAATKVSGPIALVNVNGNDINVYSNSDKDSKVYTESTQKEKEIEKEIERENEIKDISTEIGNFRSRYDPELLKLIDLYFDFIKETRKSKKISESIVLKVYEQFARYSPVRIEYAIKAHTSNPQNGKAKEEYTFGILRNCTEEEAAKRLPQMGNQNGFGNKQGYDFDEMARRLKEQNGR